MESWDVRYRNLVLRRPGPVNVIGTWRKHSAVYRVNILVVPAEIIGGIRRIISASLRTSLAHSRFRRESDLPWSCRTFEGKAARLQPHVCSHAHAIESRKGAGRRILTLYAQGECT